MYKLTEVIVSPPKEFFCKYLMPDSNATEKMRILIVSFNGNYPPGSSGNAHGAYIAVMTMHGLHAFDPDCVILDFRNMTYQWGNTLLRVFEDVSTFKDIDKQENEPLFPVIVVTSSKCQPAIQSLIGGSTGLITEWHFESLDAAIVEGVKLAKEWLEN